MTNVIKSALQVGLMLLGLTGLVDNIVEWQGFLANIVAEYTKIRDFLFGWLPFSPPGWVKDYLVIGVAVASCFLSTVFRQGFTFQQGMSGAYAGLLFSYLIWPFLWPFVIVLMALVLIKGPPDKDAPDTDTEDKDEAGLPEENVHEDAKIFGRKLGTAAVLFLGALFVASDALELLLG